MEIQYYYDTLLALVCLSIAVFAVYAVKKLYQGQR